MTFLEKLRNKWNLKNITQVILILVIFALTGTTVLLIKEPIISFFIDEDEKSVWFNIIYFILIFPFYNVILLAYGFIFGQFKFFWEFEKRSFRRIVRSNKE